MSERDSGRTADIWGEHGVAYSAATAFFLGFSMCLGLWLLSCDSEFAFHLGLYVFVLAFFHTSEFTVVALYDPPNCSVNSFMVNHSSAYHIATAASFTEFIVEYYFFPSLKTCSVWVLGLVIVVAGECVRKAAFYYARHNFTHLIQDAKRPNHKLVTTGIYSYFRHPGYFGWFWWSIGTQVLCMNPICTLAFAYASWAFFHGRIPFEEQKLIEFFGDEYIRYRKQTPILIPFIPTL
eukprot:JP446931.1.p1 GENE.JP446931.1~~JP446931.1.p1  ORF type:complete len:236 (-),score=34.44 JP446931.1:28-735(-)